MSRRCSRCRRRLRTAGERPMRKIERRLKKVDQLADKLVPAADGYYPAEKRLKLIKEHCGNAKSACEEVKGYPATREQLEDLEIEAYRMQGVFEGLIEKKSKWWKDHGGKKTGFTLSELRDDLDRMGSAMKDTCKFVESVKSSRKVK
mgnify:CR=1 FL=1